MVLYHNAKIIIKNIEPFQKIEHLIGQELLTSTLEPGFFQPQKGCCMIFHDKRHVFINTVNPLINTLPLINAFSPINAPPNIKIL